MRTKPGGQNMQQEATEKLIGVERHGASLVSVGVVSPTKGDPTVGHGNEARVGDGDAVGIAREIGQDLRGSGKGSLGIHDPVAMGSGVQQSGKQLLAIGEELSWPARISLRCLKSLFESLRETFHETPD